MRKELRRARLASFLLRQTEPDLPPTFFGTTCTHFRLNRPRPRCWRKSRCRSEYLQTTVMRTVHSLKHKYERTRWKRPKSVSKIPLKILALSLLTENVPRRRLASICRGSSDSAVHANIDRQSAHFVLPRATLPSNVSRLQVL